MLLVVIAIIFLIGCSLIVFSTFFAPINQTLEYIQNDWGSFAISKFGDKASAPGCINHIKTELLELEEEFEALKKVPRHSTEEGKILRNIEEELSDVIVLICHAAALLHLNIAQGTINKIAKNKRRVWGEPDKETGIIHHVSEGVE
jgi:hypothetical protein